MKNVERTVWTNDRRRMLESLLKQGFRVTKISEALGISSTTIYKEIKRGVSEEEYNMHQYIKYSADASINKQMEAIKAFLEGEE